MLIHTTYSSGLIRQISILIFNANCIKILWCKWRSRTIFVYEWRERATWLQILAPLKSVGVLPFAFNKTKVSPLRLTEIFHWDCCQSASKYTIFKSTFLFTFECLFTFHALHSNLIQKFIFDFILFQVCFELVHFLLLVHLENPHGNIWANNMVGEWSHILYCWVLN